jgi:hypothetical protein
MSCNGSFESFLVGAAKFVAAQCIIRMSRIITSLNY